MQYSLKTLLFATSVLAILAALIIKFGVAGLLGGIVLMLALVICYCLTKLPLPHSVANGILLAALGLHIALINFFFPLVGQWVIEAVRAAEKQGPTIPLYKYESPAQAMYSLMIIVGYLPAFVVLLVRVLLIHLWECSGLSRLVLSLWLLLIPFLSAWFELHRYQPLELAAIRSFASSDAEESAMIKFVVRFGCSKTG